MTTHRKLPIGIQTFSQVITGGYYYVDKTALIARLVNEDKYYFLSRPRRFGKSLLIDTLKELFECHEVLFRQLAIHDQWDWKTPSPVIHISFNDGGLRDSHDLTLRMFDQLAQNAERLGVPLTKTDNPVTCFAALIRHTRAHHGQGVVVLVDEYDKPILDHILDKPTAIAMRENLKGFYSVIIGADADIRFAFITGVSKFSKVSLFSGLNNLRDITVSPAYATLCGYTDHDIDTVFAPELPGLNRDEIRQWYNGYHWLGEAVYNPFGVLLLFRERRFKPHWFETGTPTFLVKLLTERQTFLPTLGQLSTDAEVLSSFDVDNISTTALLFQTGYLTLDKEEHIGGNYYYTLRFPNREVEQGLFDSLLKEWTAGHDQHKRALYQALTNTDLSALKQLFHAFFASIPHQWFDNNPIARYEGYYASVFYSYFVATGLSVRAEDTTNLGQIDMMVRLPGKIFLFEFKVVNDTATGQALQQIKDKRYADKYAAEGLPVHLIGVEFSRKGRNVLAVEMETI